MDTTKVKINLPYTKVRQIASAIERAAAKGKPADPPRGDG
jgi:hypothetical protein